MEISKPSYKKDWKDNPRNYRSVSLTFIPRKMTEEIKSVLLSLTTRLNHRKCISVNCSLPIWIIELNLLMCTIQEFLLPTCSEMWNSWLCLATKHFCIGFMKSLVFFSLWIAWEHYMLTSPVTLKQFISITKNPAGFGYVSNNKIPVKSSKPYWSLVSLL